MVKWKLVSLVLCCLVVLPGCAISKATLEGHDFVAAGLDNLMVGIKEYHADDLERMRMVRARLSAALVKDIVAAGGEQTRTETITQQFLVLLERAELAESVEERRYHNMRNSIRALLEVNSGLRDMATIRLGWKIAAIEYANALRRKIENGPN